MNLLLAQILLQHDYKLSPIQYIGGFTWDKIFETSNRRYLAVDFYRNGNVKILRFFVSREEKLAVHHRQITEGPAEICFDQNGKISRQEFVENGVKIK